MFCIMLLWYLVRMTGDVEQQRVCLIQHHICINHHSLPLDHQYTLVRQLFILGTSVCLNRFLNADVYFCKNQTEVDVYLFLPDRDASCGPAEKFFSELGQEAEWILETFPHMGRQMPPN